MSDGLKHEAYLTLAPDVAMATALMLIWRTADAVRTVCIWNTVTGFAAEPERQEAEEQEMIFIRSAFGLRFLHNSRKIVVWTGGEALRVDSKVHNAENAPDCLQQNHFSTLCSDQMLSVGSIKYGEHIRSDAISFHATRNYEVQT